MNGNHILIVTVPSAINLTHYKKEEDLKKGSQRVDPVKIKKFGQDLKVWHCHR